MTDSHVPPIPETLSQPPVRLALVGCGHWGKNLARNFYYLESLAAICEANPNVLETLSAQYPDIRLTHDIKTCLADPLIDGIVIATPSQSHFALAQAALQAGKHVYVEKPMATNSHDAQVLLHLAAEQQRVLMVGHLLLYHPVVNRLRQLVQAGYLGEIKYIQSDRLNFNPNRNDKSVLWDLAPHDLSMMLYVLGGAAFLAEKPEESEKLEGLEKPEAPEAIVSVHGHQTGEDGLIDVAHIELAFAHGIAGHIYNSWIHPTKQVRLIVRGTERTAILDDTLADGKLRVFNADSRMDLHKIDLQRLESSRPVLEEETPDYLAIEPLKLECQHFIYCIRSGQAPHSDGLNGLRVVQILEAAEAQLQLRGPSGSSTL